MNFVKKLSIKFCLYILTLNTLKKYSQKTQKKSEEKLTKITFTIQTLKVQLFFL